MGSPLKFALKMIYEGHVFISQEDPMLCPGRRSGGVVVNRYKSILQKYTSVDTVDHVFNQIAESIRLNQYGGK